MTAPSSIILDDCDKRNYGRSSMLNRRSPVCFIEPPKIVECGKKEPVDNKHLTEGTETHLFQEQHLPKCTRAVQNNFAEIDTTC